ncbi:MAG: arginine--tRNA ligase [Deltaproteobacteria bacterium]|nr:arginine--tRNA ligase [Deltaproteobacteria bacterium]
MKSKLRDILQRATELCFQKGRLEETPLPEFVVEVPNNPEHGHFATNLPMVLAASQKRSPRDLAALIIEHMEDKGDVIEKTEIAGPGFINFTLTKKAWHSILITILAHGKDYGRSKAGQGEKILVEFVSANPTGPLHLGHGRGAALGDTLCRILAFTGFEVVREFYTNDAGRQIRLLGQSIFSRWQQMSDPDYTFPEEGYWGGYVSELAEEISEHYDLTAFEPVEAIDLCAEIGKEKMLNEIKEDLKQFRTTIDVCFSENELYTNGTLHKTLAEMNDMGASYEKDAALWIKTSLFGDDKDRVIKKQDGQYTYFAADISYHLDKYRRGFSKAINIWGADHHGYVQRVKAALKTYGIEGNWLAVLLIQLVKLWKGGQELKMSKRAGQYVTLKELIDEVGVDAARFVFLTKNHDSTLDFDVDMVKKNDSDNPVYYVQYAHARICSIFRKAASEGITLSEEPGEVLKHLVLDEELTLMRTLSEFPALIEDIATTYEPHRLTYYLTELASLFHRYFNLGTKEPEKRIVTSEIPLSQARLNLAEAVRTVIHNGLDLLGVSAPDRM